ncbi:MAG TPA: hypothetical protein VES93_09025 [Ornithinibacter sp.]|nr:hypothetical protein [Ornithinibacter sp.]
MLTSQARPVLGLVSCVMAASLLAGCTDDAEPTTTSSSSSPTVSSAGPASSTGAPATTTASASPTVTLPTVAEVYRDARTSALAAQSGSAVGTVTGDGTRLRIDVSGLANGSNQKVFITTPDGGTAEVLTIGDSYWIGGDEAYWAEATGDATAAKSLVGKYAPITESDATELGSFRLRDILTDLFELPELGVLESNTGPARRTEVDGRAVYVLGREGGPRLWVAADGSGTLLRAVGAKSEPTDLTFSDWDRARTFTAPPASKLLEN